MLPKNDNGHQVSDYVLLEAAGIDPTVLTQPVRVDLAHALQEIVAHRLHVPLAYACFHHDLVEEAFGDGQPDLMEYLTADTLPPDGLLVIQCFPRRKVIGIAPTLEAAQVLANVSSHAVAEIRPLNGGVGDWWYCYQGRLLHPALYHPHPIHGVERTI